MSVPRTDLPPLAFTQISVRGQTVETLRAYQAAFRQPDYDGTIRELVARAGSAPPPPKSTRAPRALSAGACPSTTTLPGGRLVRCRIVGAGHGSHAWWSSGPNARTELRQEWE